MICWFSEYLFKIPGMSGSWEKSHTGIIKCKARFSDHLVSILDCKQQKQSLIGFKRKGFMGKMLGINISAGKPGWNESLHKSSVVRVPANIEMECRCWAVNQLPCCPIPNIVVHYRFPARSDQEWYGMWVVGIGWLQSLEGFLRLSSSRMTCDWQGCPATSIHLSWPSKIRL